MQNEPWRYDAINWIHRHASELPDAGPTAWHVSKPSLEARQNALHIIRFVPEGFAAPAELAVTLERGIELEWCLGSKELTIDVLADGSLEILKTVHGDPVEEKKLPKADFRLGSAFDWLAS
jgi:hypothetical protein